MTSRAPVVLSIAGSDPSGGAGIQADIKTFAAFGVDGGAVVTALTAQNEHEVRAISVVPPAFVVAQIDAVFAGADVAAVKVGMLGTAENARAVVRALRQVGARNVVVDPVLRATSGAELLDNDGLSALRDDLVSVATVVTPNVFEAGALLGAAAPSTTREMRQVGQALRRFGAEWVLITGGHVEAGLECVDVLVGDVDVIELRTPRVPGGGMRGTGCRSSSAIAALLALGRSVPAACAEAQRHVADCIAGHMTVVVEAI